MLFPLPFPPSLLLLSSSFSLLPLLCPSLSLSPPVSRPLPLPPSISPVPRVVAVSPQMRLVEDNPSSLSLVEIYKQRCAKKGIEHDNPISRYYDRLATVQARGTQASHQVWRWSCKQMCTHNIMIQPALICILGVWIVILQQSWRFFLAIL